MTTRDPRTPLRLTRALAAVAPALAVLLALAPGAEAHTLLAASLSDRIWADVINAQRELTGYMTQAVRGFKSEPPMLAALQLGVISFVYGVLHAVGPGHGKFVISSYALANRQTVRRGILLSFMAALMQAVSAILLVVVLVIAVKATSIEMHSAENWLETVSWLLVAALGASLLWREVGPLLGFAAAHDHGAHDHDHHDHDHHDPNHGHGDHDHHDHAHHDHDHHTHDHDHDHDHAAALTAGPKHGEPGHVHDASCGHLHMPDPRDLQGTWSWRKAWMIAATVGIRPCTGAIVVMLFAMNLGLLAAGIFSTFAMSIGTAITVSTLAALAIVSRSTAERLTSFDGRFARGLERTLGIGFGVLILAMGLVFAAVSIYAPSPL